MTLTAVHLDLIEVALKTSAASRRSEHLNEILDWLDQERNALRDPPPGAPRGFRLVRAARSRPTLRDAGYSSSRAAWLALSRARDWARVYAPDWQRELERVVVHRGRIVVALMPE